MKYFWPAVYVASIVLVNWGFAHARQYELLWSLMVGSIFISRDMVQRSIGHWCFVPMAVGLALSYLLADPFVALASTAAFFVSETTDWLVYTITRRPLRDRLLLSTAISAPVDTLVFLGLIGALMPQLIAVQITTKIAAAVIVWIPMRLAHA